MSARRRCRECGAPIVNPLALATRTAVCSVACADALGARLMANGTPIGRVAYPEDAFRCERVFDHSRRLATIASTGAKLDLDGDEKKHRDARVKQLRRRAKKFDWIDAVKRAAARCGRTLYQKDEHVRARAKLRKVLDDLPTPILRYLARVRLLDPRFCGASGTGAYIAVGTRCANEGAIAILRARGRGRPVFEVVASSPGMHATDRQEDAA